MDKMQKFFEVRDKATTASVMCIQMDLMKVLYTQGERSVRIASRAGYAFNPTCILFHPMAHDKIKYDPCEWGDRTYQVAHDYIIKNWETLESGDIVDVEYILGERDKPKTTDL